MSLQVLERLLSSMGIIMDEDEKKEVYDELRREFSLRGGNECGHLELLIENDEDREKIEEFIRRWMRCRKAVCV